MGLCVPLKSSMSIQSISQALNSEKGFFQLLKGESNQNWKQILIYAIISGVTNSILIATINAAAEDAEMGETDNLHLLIFALAFGLFFLTKRFILVRTTHLVEGTIARIRKRVVHKLLRTDLDRFEELAEADVITSLSSDINLVTGGAAIIISAMQSCFMVACVLIYIATISVMSLVIVLGTIVVGAIMYLSKQKSLQQDFQGARVMESQFYALLSGISAGFKELKLNKRKVEDIYDDTVVTVNTSRDIKSSVGTAFATMHMFSETVFYLLLAGVVFVAPSQSDDNAETIVPITGAIMFIIGPLSNIVSSVQLFSRANIAIANIYRLEREIEVNAVGEEPEDDPESMDLPTPSDFSGFKEIQLVGIEYRYPGVNGDQGFDSGPFNLTIRRGETIVIVGGNGSGKTTLLKLLTGLYHTQQGHLQLDDIQITRAELHSYRELFSAVFTDYHLFSKLYGVRMTPEKQVKLESLLLKMGIAHKTAYSDGKFSTLNLSTGQRKRLGLAISLMEDKPVYIFDEVTADQDPEFREYFYNTILKELKEKEKTVILVSHDDRYFHYGDRLLKMDFGKLQEEKPRPVKRSPRPKKT